MMVAMFVRRQLVLQDRTPAMKLCLGSRGSCPIDRIPFWHRMVSKTVVLLAISGSFAIPFFLIPTTVHPFMGWGVFLLGSMSLLIVTISGFQLRPLGVLTPWLVCTSLLLVLAWPFYTNGIVRILFVAVYACFMSPFLWWALKEIMASVDQSAEREPLMAWTNAARSEAQKKTLLASSHIALQIAECSNLIYYICIYLYTHMHRPDTINSGGFV